MTVRYRRDWEKSGHIGKLILLLNDATQLNENGSIQFVADDHSELFDLLASAFEGVSPLTPSEYSPLIKRAFLDLRKIGCVEKQILLDDVKHRVRDALNEDPKRYTMWTKLRLRDFRLSHRTRFTLDDVTIEFVRHLPKYLHVEKHFVSGVGQVDPDVLPFFGYTIVRTTGRNVAEGTKKMFDAMDLLYSVINTSWRTIQMWEQRHPNAKLWEGPNQFVFEEKRFLGRNTVWYNPDYRLDAWNRFPSAARDFYERKENFRKILRKIERHPLRKELAAALRSVNMGMESHNLSYRLMRYWSAAEILYAPKNERTNAETILNRLTFAENDENIWIEKLKLDAVYDMRNSYVHQGNSDNDTSLLAQNLREQVLRHVYYLVFNGDDLRNIQHLVDMATMPRSSSRLDEMSLAIERRKKILATGSHRLS